MHGATKWLMLFATSLSNAGHENTIYCTDFSIPTPLWFLGRIKPFSRLAKSKELRGAAKLLSIAKQMISIPFLPFSVDKHTDVFVLHSELSLFALLSAKILFRNSKFIYYCYQPPREIYDLASITKKSYGVWYFLLSPFLLIYKSIDKLLVRWSDYVLVWSDQAQTYVKSIYGDIELYNIPASVDFRVFDSPPPAYAKAVDQQQRLHLNGKKILLMNSALTNKKNIPIFLDLIRYLVLKDYDVHGLVIGEGPEQQALAELIKDFQIGEHATLLGYVPQEDLPSYYFLADILYYLEPNGIWTMSIIEAGAARIPVIAAPGGSMPTLVVNGETGFILNDIDTSKGLIEKTVQLLEDSELCKAMGEKNYFHSKQFSVEASAARFLKIIQ